MSVIFHLNHFLPLSSKSSSEEMEEMSFFHPSGRKSFLPEETQPCLREKERRGKGKIASRRAREEEQ